MNDIVEQLREFFAEPEHIKEAAIALLSPQEIDTLRKFLDEETSSEKIARLNRELSDARNAALEEAAEIADAHASQCRSKLHKKRSDHDLAVFESAASEAESIAASVREMKEKAE